MLERKSASPVHNVLTWALNGGEWQLQIPEILPPGKEQKVPAEEKESMILIILKVNAVEILTASSE
jgi:hypothetical protein